MAKIYQIVKKQILTTVSDVVNFVVKSRLLFTQRVLYINTAAGKTISNVAQSVVAILLSRQSATASTLRAFRNGTHRLFLSAASLAGYGFRDGDHALRQVDSQASVVSTTLVLVRINGADSTSSTGDWNNAANAQGRQDGSVATISSGSLSAASGILTGALPAADTSKHVMTITKVEMRCWFRFQAALLDSGSITITAGALSLFSNSVGAAQSADDNFLSTPLVVDITADVNGDWTAIPSGWDVDVTHGAGVGTNQTSVDAIELLIEAERTET